MSPTPQSIVIAVDATAASGKGTLAKKLAAHFGFAHLDSGALYRLTALAVLEAKGDPAIEADAVRGADRRSLGCRECRARPGVENDVARRALIHVDAGTGAGHAPAQLTVADGRGARAAPEIRRRSGTGARRGAQSPLPPPSRRPAGSRNIRRAALSNHRSGRACRCGPGCLEHEVPLQDQRRGFQSDQISRRALARGSGGQSTSFGRPNRTLARSG